jgi:hypothetical protein
MEIQNAIKVLSYWAVETLGDLQSTSRGLDPVVKCKFNRIPILMHQMRILDNLYLFSDAQSDKIELRNVMTVKIPKRPQNKVL